MVFIFFAATEINAQNNDEILIGKVNEKVLIADDTKQSYGLYLPASYTPEKKWAVLYVFDPLARGAFALERFVPAAEKYNYILVGSNDSRNGYDGATIIEFIKAVWKDTHDRFSIDDKRVYATGFSGGARVATMMAALCKTCVTGVIGSGAGLSSQIKPAAEQKFMFFGAVGMDDYNFPELVKLDDTFAELKVKHRLAMFDGVHQWMPPETAEKALAWMNLQAMKSGDLPKDEKFIQEALARNVKEANGFLSKGNIVFAERSYQAIVDDFSGLTDISEYSQQLKKINKSPELKKARKTEKKQFERQEQNVKELLSVGLKKSDSEREDEINLQRTRDLISNLIKKAESDDEYESHLAKRSLAQVFAICMESATLDLIKQKKFDQAIVNLELASEISPKNRYVRYELAKTYALDGQKKQALDALDEAIKLGFQNLKQLESEEGFNNLKDEERFISLIENLRKNLESSNRK